MKDPRLSEAQAASLVSVTLKMFEIASEHVEATHMLSALASVQTAVLLNVIAPHQRSMAVDDIARTTLEALGDIGSEWRQKMH